MVEHPLGKSAVAGSNPALGSKFHQQLSRCEVCLLGHLRLQVQRYELGIAQGSPSKDGFNKMIRLLREDILGKSVGLLTSLPIRNSLSGY